MSDSSLKACIEKMARWVNDQGLPPPLKTERCCACGSPMMTPEMERAIWGTAYKLVESGADESTGKSLCRECAEPVVKKHQNGEKK